MASFIMVVLFLVIVQLETLEFLVLKLYLNFNCFMVTAAITAAITAAQFHLDHC